MKSVNIEEMLIDHTLPPPIYGCCLTIKPSRATRQIKLVKAIHTHPLGVRVEGLGGEEYIVSNASIKYMVIAHEGE